MLSHKYKTEISNLGLTLILDPFSSFTSMSFCDVQYFGNHFFLSNSISSMMESEINGKLNPRKLASSSAFPPARKNIRH